MKTMTFASLVLLIGLAEGQSPTTTKPSSPFGGGTGGFSGSTFGTQPPGGFSTVKKSGLEEAIDLALLNNPDLRVAVAKVREAEATMSRTRLQVLQKVVAAYQGIDEAKAAASHAEKNLSRVKRLRSAKAASEEDLQQAEVSVSKAKAAQAQAQAELDYLLGKAPAKAGANKLSDFYKRTGHDATAALLQAAIGADPMAPVKLYLEASMRGPAADRLRKALDRKVTLKFADTPARDVLAKLRKEADGVHIQASEKAGGWDEKVTATLDNVPLAAALQLLEDVLGDYRIVVREYGLLIATKSQVPPGATLLADFLRDGAKSEKAATPSPASK